MGTIYQITLNSWKLYTYSPQTPSIVLNISNISDTPILSLCYTISDSILVV